MMIGFSVIWPYQLPIPTHHDKVKTPSYRAGLALSFTYIGIVEGHAPAKDLVSFWQIRAIMLEELFIKSPFKNFENFELIQSIALFFLKKSRKL